MPPWFAAAGLLLAFASPAAAQEEDETAVMAVSTEESVLLRWTLPGSRLPDEAFVVERTDEAGTTRRFTIPAPMAREDAVGRGLIGGDEYADLVELFTPDESSSEQERREREFNRAMFTLVTITRPGWAQVLGNSFDDTTVTAGTSYVYTVTATVDGEAVTIGEAEVTAGDPAAAPNIGGLEAETSADGIDLRWNLAEAGLVVAYLVYRTDPDGTERLLTETGLFVSRRDDPETGESRPPDVFLRDTAVAADQTYTYSVAGVDVFGRETPRSEPLTVFFPDPVPLEVPLVTAVDVRDGEIELFWAAPADPRVAGVGVLRSEDPVDEGALLTPDFLTASETSFVDTTTFGGVSYYYSLVTMDGDGRRFGPGPPRAARGINLTPPSAPADLELTATDSSLDLSWTAPPEPDVHGYEVFALRGGAGQGGDAPRNGDPARRVLLTSEPVAGTTYRLAVPAGTLDEITLAVRALNTSFVEGPLSEPVSGRLIDVVPPDRPILGAIRAGEGEVEVSWPFTTDPDVAGYRILRAVQGEEAFTAIREDLAPEDTLVVDTDVTPGLLHAYTVEAIDASGNVSERASPLAATPYRLAGPGAPRNLRVLAAEDGGVELRWEAPEGDGILAYVVERADENGSFLQLGDPLLADVRAFSDRRGRPGFAYRVYAIDTAGNAGAPSAEAGLPEEGS